jgi:hypothetical protein
VRRRDPSATRGAQQHRLSPSASLTRKTTSNPQGRAPERNPYAALPSSQGEGSARRAGSSSPRPPYRLPLPRPAPASPRRRGPQARGEE